MTTKVHIVPCVLLLLLAGCATPYQKNPGIVGGYRDIQLADDTFLVTFKGNGYTSAERAYEFCLRRAAEVTIAHGFTWFAVVDERENTTTQNLAVTPSTTTATGTSTDLGRTTVYQHTSTTQPSQRWLFRFPNQRLTIRCFHERLAPEAVDARLLLSNYGRPAPVASKPPQADPTR